MNLKDDALRRAVERPDPQVRLYLLYGPDEATSAALATTLGRALGKDAERVDIEPATLKGEPGRLADEAASMGLFGERRFVRVAASGDECAAAIALLLAAPAAGNPVVITTGALKATAASVKLAAASPLAVAGVSYALEGARAVTLATALARDLGLRMDPEVAQRLVRAVGADRALLAQELEKLALYLDAAPERPATLDGAALDAAGAAIEDGSLSGLFIAVLDGAGDAVVRELHALAEAGTSPVTILRGFAGHLVRLAAMRAQADAGEPIPRLTERVFFREKAAWGRHLSAWTSAQLATALSRVQAAQRAVMRADPVTAIAAEELVAIARVGARRR